MSLMERRSVHTVEVTRGLAARASQLDAEVVLSDLRYGDVDTAAVAWPWFDRGAEVVAEGGGEMLFDAGLVSEHGTRGVEGAVGEVVALGPALPGAERLDAAALFADGGEHRVEEVDGVAVAELFVGVAPVGDRLGVAFDGGGGSLAGACEVVLGSFELLLGDVDFGAQGAALSAWGGVESMLGGCVTAPCFDGAGVGVVQGVSVGGGCCCHLGEDGVGVGRGGGCLGAPRCPLRLAGLGVEQGALCFGEDGWEPVRDLAARRRSASLG